MPRIELKYRAVKVDADLLKAIGLRLLKTVARVLSTDMGPVIEEECSLEVQPFGELDLPMNDLHLIVRAHAFADRTEPDKIAEALRAYILATCGSRGISVSVWVDLVNMGYAEFPERTS